MCSGERRHDIRCNERRQSVNLIIISIYLKDTVEFANIVISIASSGGKCLSRLHSFEIRTVSGNLLAAGEAIRQPVRFHDTGRSDCPSCLHEIPPFGSIQRMARRLHDSNVSLAQSMFPRFSDPSVTPSLSQPTYPRTFNPVSSFRRIPLAPTTVTDAINRRKSAALQSAIKNLTALDAKVQELIDARKAAHQRMMAAENHRPMSWSAPVGSGFPQSYPMMQAPGWFLSPQMPQPYGLPPQYHPPYMVKRILYVW
jgi:hypothetical protein